MACEKDRGGNYKAALLRMGQRGQGSENLARIDIKQKKKAEPHDPAFDV